MTTRLLPRSEWAALAETELGPFLDRLPASTQVIAVEDRGGALLGCCALVPLWHAEGLWIHPAHRGRSAVARSVWQGVQTLAADADLHAVLTVMLPEMEDLFRHAGARALPGLSVAIPVGDD